MQSVKQIKARRGVIYYLSFGPSPPQLHGLRPAPLDDTVV